MAGIGREYIRQRIDELLTKGRDRTEDENEEFQRLKQQTQAEADELNARFTTTMKKLGFRRQ